MPANGIKNVNPLSQTKKRKYRMKEKYKNAIAKYKNLIYPIITLGAIILIWYVIALSVNKELLLPAPKTAFSALFRLLGESLFWKSFFYTLGRTLLSFFAAFVAAVIFSVLAVLFPPIDKALSPIVIITRAVPTMSVILFALIWFTDAITPLFIAFLVIFPTLYASFYSALINVNNDEMEMAKAYKVKRIYVIKDLYYPAVLPRFLDAMRSALSLNVKLIIAAEVLASTRYSIGEMMQLSKLYLETADLLAWTIMAIIMSYLLELSVLGLRKLLVRWE